MNNMISGYFIMLFVVVVSIFAVYHIIKWISQSCDKITIVFTIDITLSVTHIDYLKIGCEYMNDISNLLNSRSIAQDCSAYPSIGSITGTITYKPDVRRKMNGFEVKAIELFDNKYKNKNLSLSKLSWK